MESDLSSTINNQINSDLNAINELDLTQSTVYFGSYKVKVPKININEEGLILKSVVPKYSPKAQNNGLKMHISIPFHEFKTLSLSSKFNKIYMIIDIIPEAVTKIQKALGLTDFKSLDRYTGHSNDPCARYISIISEDDKVDIKRISQLLYDSKVADNDEDALKIIELSANPVPYNGLRITYSRSKSPPKRVLRSSLIKDLNDDNATGLSNQRLPQKRNQETQTEDECKKRKTEISSEAQTIINLFKSLKSRKEKKLILEMLKTDFIEENDDLNPVPQVINHETQSINPGNNQDENEIIKQLSKTIKQIHENWIKKGLKCRIC